MLRQPRIQTPAIDLGMGDARKIARAGETLFGPKWCAPLAKAASVDARYLLRIRDAARERTPFVVKPYVMMAVRALVIRRNAEIGILALLFP